MRKRLLIAALCTAAAVLTVSAEAATVVVVVNAAVVAGSTLSVAGNGTPPSFSLTLNGADQTTTYTLPVSVVDARGMNAGGGWNLTVTSTQFSDGAGHTFPTTASTITGLSPATACGAGSTCTLPTNSVSSSNLALPAGSTPPAAVKWFNAANATGLGTANINATVSVFVPANVFAATYSSTLTLAIVAGP
jgi:hypothetical protein